VCAGLGMCVEMICNDSDTHTFRKGRRHKFYTAAAAIPYKL
jgi:hypothetical protein